MEPSTPTVAFRIWKDDAWTDPAPYLEDVDRYLREAFHHPWFDREESILIETGGRPWSSWPATDPGVDVGAWFAAGAAMAGGAEGAEVWRHARSVCRMRRFGDRLEVTLRLRDGNEAAPRVSWPLATALQALLAAGERLLALHDTAAARLQELVGAGGWRSEEVAGWSAGLPREELEADTPWSLEARWEAVLRVPRGVAERERLRDQLEAMRSFLERDVEDRSDEPGVPG